MSSTEGMRIKLTETVLPTPLELPLPHLRPEVVYLAGYDHGCLITLRASRSVVPSRAQWWRKAMEDEQRPLQAPSIPDEVDAEPESFATGDRAFAAVAPDLRRCCSGWAPTAAAPMWLGLDPAAAADVGCPDSGQAVVVCHLALRKRA